MTLSVVTINYNNASGLLKTIESIRQQTFVDFEHIIIDGGSTDGSVDVIKDYADKITYWVSEPDKGIYHAMNKGIVQAKGEYIQLLNSGDWMCEPTILQRVFSKYSEADIVYGNMLKVYPDGKIVNDKGFERSNLTLADMFFHTLNHSSSFIRRKLFDVYGLYDESYKIVSDWVFFLKAIGLGNVSVEYIDIDINYFDMTGISNKQLQLRFQERKEELEKCILPQIRKDYEVFGILQKRTKVLDKIEGNKLSNFLFKVFKKIFVR